MTCISIFRGIKCLGYILAVIFLLSPSHVYSQYAELGAALGAAVVQDIQGTLALAGTMITAGASLTDTTVDAMSMSGPNRNVVIEITNHLNHSLVGGHHFLQSGWNGIPPPPVIRQRTKEALQFEKVGHTATGTTGIVSYTVDDDADPFSFLIVWSVPFNYIHSSNWFGLSYIEGGTSMNAKLYNELYYDPGWKNREARTDRKFGYAYEGKPVVMFKGDYIVSASMSNAGRSILKVDVLKRSGGHAKHHHKFHGVRFNRVQIFN